MVTTLHPDTTVSGNSFFGSACDVFSRSVRMACAVIFGTLSLLTLGLAASAARSSDSIPSLFGRDFLIVKSGSMSPAFNTGDAVIVRQIADPLRVALHPGQVVTFRSLNNPHLIITHRIIDAVDAGTAHAKYTTKGDANQTADFTPLTPTQVIGVVSTHIPRAGFIMSALQRPRVSAIFFLALVLSQLGVMSTRAAISTPKEKRNR